MQYILPAFFLGIGSTILELRAVYSLAWLRNFIGNHPISGLILSVVVTAFLGSLFGAAGLVALMAAVFSIVITGIVYRIDRIIRAFRKDDENVAA